MYIFDRVFQFLGILETFDSLRWIRRYHRSGEFELHTAITPYTLNLLQRGYIVWKKGDQEGSIIKYRQLTQDQEGKEKLVVKGDFLTGVLGQRIIWQRTILETTAEMAMRRMVDENCITTAADRVIPFLTLGTLKGYTPVVSYQTAYKYVLEELENLSNLSGLGYRVLFDWQTRKWIFDVYEGRNLTAGQTALPPAVFAREYENVLQQEYTDSLHNYRNVALVAGEGEGLDRKTTVVGQAQGLDRYELFVDARDVKTTTRNESGQEIKLTDQEYESQLAERGRAKLAEQTELRTFEAKVLARGNLIYRQDYDLGDVVTVVSKQWGVQVDTRITEIEEVYEPNNTDIFITFGNNIPTLMDRIKQIVR